MPRSSVKKQAFIEVLQHDYTLPTENQKIVRFLKSIGSNLHEVETPDNSILIVSMPKKLRCCMWMKKGDFLVVEPIEEAKKVKAEIVKVLSKDQIKFYKMKKVWPEEFIVKGVDTKRQVDDSENYLFVNENRITFSDNSKTDSSDSSDSDSDSEEEDIDSCESQAVDSECLKK